MIKNNFSMTAYTGVPVESDYYGQLVIDLSGIRFDDKLPALFHHHADRPAGVITDIQKSDSLTAKGYFTNTSDGNNVKSLLNEGYPYQASVGIWADEIEVLEKNETVVVNGRSFTGGAVWRKSHLREISFVSLGRDADTKVSIAASAALPTNQENTEFMTLAYALKKEKGCSMQSAFSETARKFPDAYKRHASGGAEEKKPALNKRSNFMKLATNIKKETGCTFEKAFKQIARDYPDVYNAHARGEI